MKQTAVLYALAAVFALTLVVGILTPEEVDHLLDRSLEYMEADIPPEPETSTEAETTETKPLYPVLRVIDGDTIVVDQAGVSETVRLIGIDTPETVHPSKPVQCFGTEAAKMTKSWLTDRRVSLEFDPGEGERDKYHRLLAYVYRDDGLFVNLELIRQGYAFEYTYDLPYLHQAEFKEAEAAARAGQAGLWSSAACAETG